MSGPQFYCLLTGVKPFGAGFGRSGCPGRDASHVAPATAPDVVENKRAFCRSPDSDPVRSRFDPEVKRASRGLAKPFRFGTRGRRARRSAANGTPVPDGFPKVRRQRLFRYREWRTGPELGAAGVNSLGSSRALNLRLSQFSTEIGTIYCLLIEMKGILARYGRVVGRNTAGLVVRSGPAHHR